MSDDLGMDAEAIAALRRASFELQIARLSAEFDAIGRDMPIRWAVVTRLARAYAWLRSLLHRKGAR